MNGNDSNQSQQRKTVQYIPVNDTEYMSRVTEPGWGKTQDIPVSFDNSLKRRVYYRDEEGNLYLDKNGNPVFDETSIWEMISFYTRDVRLGNLSELNNEMTVVRYYLKLAGDLLVEGYPESSIISLSEAINILETSQSKGGFFRKRQGTITQEQQYEEKGKKSLFDLGRKQ
jgi:hypothetical protein